MKKLSWTNQDKNAWLWRNDEESRRFNKLIDGLIPSFNLKQFSFPNLECLRVHLWDKDYLSQLFSVIAVSDSETTAVTTTEYSSTSGCGCIFLGIQN